MAPRSQRPGRAPTQPLALHPPASPGPQLPPQGTGLGGHWLAGGCRAGGPVASQDCGPCPVTGRPSGASNCSQRQNNARRAARAPWAAPQHPAGEPPLLPRHGQPHAGVPQPLAASWPIPVPHSGKLRWLLVSHGTAQHSMALRAAQSPAPSSSTFVPRHVAHPAAATHGREGTGGSRSAGACRELGHRPGHWNQPPALRGFKPLPVPEQAAPTLPVPRHAAAVAAPAPGALLPLGPAGVCR